jgi:hypothetical protein
MKQPDQLVADSMKEIFGSFKPSNPIQREVKRPLPEEFILDCKLTLLDGTPVVGYSIGMGELEAKTDYEGKLQIVKKKDTQ